MDANYTPLQIRTGKYTAVFFAALALLVALVWLMFYTYYVVELPAWATVPAWLTLGILFVFLSKILSAAYREVKELHAKIEKGEKS